MRNFTLLIGFAILFATSAYGQDCKEGEAAYAAGNYAKATTILQPLVAKGDACAQYQLGEMYMQGKGVPEDKARALELFKKSAAQGNDKARLMAGFLDRK
jgi:uncharacterized protein